MASLSVAKNKDFIFSTDHYPSLLLTNATGGSSPSWPITRLVYILPNTIPCLKPTVAEAQKSVIRNREPAAAVDGWLQQQNWRIRHKGAALFFQWGVKTQTDLWREKPKKTFLPKHILLFKRCVVRTLHIIFDNFSSQGSFRTIKNSFSGF